MKNDLATTIGRMFDLQKVKYLGLGYDQRLAEINAGRVVEMAMDDYKRNLRDQPQFADQLLAEDLEDMEKAAKHREAQA